MRMKGIALCALLACSLNFWHCTSSASIAGATDMPNESGSVSAMIRYADGSIAAACHVTLTPADYVVLPVLGRRSAVGTVRQVMTDSDGRFTIDNLDRGEYAIEVNDLQTCAGRIRFSFTPSAPTHDLGVQVIRPYATVIVLPDTAAADDAQRFIQIVGLNRLARLDATGPTRIDSLPADTFLLRCVGLDPVARPVLTHQMVAVPAQSSPLLIPWSHSRRFILNTTADGANIGEELHAFPVLIRLQGTDFEFDQAQRQGQDVRFTRPDGTSLPTEIEVWDPADATATLWVLMDTIRAAQATQSIVMHWGNPAASPQDSPESVFPGSAGFQAVWHLSDSPGQTVQDAGANGLHGTPVATSLHPDGIIGACQAFDGRTSYIHIVNSARSALDFSEMGTYSLSAWVHVSRLDSTYRMILSKGDYQYSLEVMDSNTWEFAECQDISGFAVVQSPAQAGEWTLLTGVRDGGRQYLYVNGICVDSSTQLLSPGAARSTDADVMIGRRSDLATYYFDGLIDEVRIHDRALSAAWNRLCYQNQKADNALIRSP